MNNFNIKRLKQIAENVCNYNNKESIVNMYKYNKSRDIFLQVLDDPFKISSVYQRYCENKNYLYLAGKDEIEEAINTNAVYIGALNKIGEVVGLVKLGKLATQEPFFMPPKNEVGGENFYGESGLFVDMAYRGKDVAKRLTENVINIARENDATGIYADFDYRNVKSGKVIMSYYDMIGCTDGTQGNEDEQSTYLTFYKSFKTQPVFQKELTIDLQNKTAEEASQQVKTSFESFGEMETYEVPYGDGFNTIYVANDVNTFENINLIQDKVQ